MVGRVRRLKTYTTGGRQADAGYKPALPEVGKTAFARPFVVSLSNHERTPFDRLRVNGKKDRNRNVGHVARGLVPRMEWSGGAGR